MRKTPKEKKEKQERLPLRTAAAYILRGYSIWWKTDSRLLISRGVSKVVTALLPYLTLYFTARLVNAIAMGGASEQVWPSLWALLISTAAAGLLRAAAVSWSETLNGHLWGDWNQIFFEKLLTMDFCDVDNPKTQDLFIKIQQNSNWASWGLLRLLKCFDNLLGALFGILGAVALSISLFTLPVPPGNAFAWLNHPLCLLGMAGLMILSVCAASAFASKGNSFWAAVDGAKGNRLFFFTTCIAIAEPQRSTDIRMYAQDQYLVNMGRKTIEDKDSFGPKSGIGRAARGPMGLCMAASGAVSQAFTGVIYLFAGLKALGGAFGIGSVTQYVGALAGLAQGLSGLLEALGELRTNAEFLKPVYEFLDTPNRMYQGSLTTEKRSDRRYEIEFRDVSFKYPDTDTWALRNVSLRFRAGKRLAVVGENGSGKTTFIKLLCRLYDPDEGEILLNGIDIRKYRYDEYLALFSVVFQDFQLLSQGLGQNVAAAEEYDRARAEDCLMRAGFGERLSALPKGLDTCLYREFEEDGVEISGGEAQKIALARVLYQDAPFIVLDEPTAALDPEAEAEIYTRFNDIIENKTAVYISHRLSSCRFCDEIAVFDHGRVVQQGSHDALVCAEGKYRSLWEAQAQYYTHQE